MDDFEDDMYDIFNDPAYRTYDRMLHGPYIAALMSRADARKLGGAARASSLPLGASTLSDEVRAAFAESQANLTWTPEEDESEDKDTSGGAKSRRELRDVSSEQSDADSDDFEKIRDDFVIPEPAAPLADDDFEITRDDDFEPIA